MDRPLRVAARRGPLAVTLAPVLVLLLSLAASTLAQDAPSVAVGEPRPAVHVYYFWGDGCPVCATQRTYLEWLQARYPEVVVHAFEVWYEVPHRALLQAFSDAFDQPMTAVPVTFIGDRGWIGFSQVTAMQMTQVVEAVREAGGPDAGARVPTEVLARFLESGE